MVACVSLPVRLGGYGQAFQAAGSNFPERLATSGVLSSQRALRWRWTQRTCDSVVVLESDAAGDGLRRQLRHRALRLAPNMQECVARKFLDCVDDNARQLERTSEIEVTKRPRDVEASGAVVLTSYLKGFP